MADYDDPRPSSQPEGSTDLKVAKDNLITLDKVAVSTELTVTNRKGVPVTTFAGSTAAIDSSVKEVSDAADAALIQIDADLATVADEVNTINDSVAAAASSEANAEISATEAAASALISQSNANFVGKWSLQTGAVAPPYSVNDDTGDGYNYQLLESVADVTASQPSLNPSQWKIIIDVVMPNPDVHLPFGNKIVETAIGSLSFERTSMTGSINKSGVSELLDIDEPAITRNGLSIYESFDNKITNREDLTNAIWSKVGVTATANEMTEDTSTGVHSVLQISGEAVSTGYYTVTYNVKQNAGDRSVRIRLADSSGYLGDAFFNLETGLAYTTSTGVTTTTEELNDGSFVISATIASSNGNPHASLYLVENNSIVSSYTGDGVSSVIVNNSSLTLTQFSPPYTGADSDSRSSDDISIPMSGNFPQQNSEFTIAADVKIKGFGTGAVYSTSGQDSISGFVLRENNGDLLFFIGDGSTLVNLDVPVTAGNRRVCITYKSGNLSMHVDGVLQDSDPSLSTSYNILSNLLIGKRSAGSYLNSEVSNLMIFFGGLSNGQIAQLGAAQ